MECWSIGVLILKTKKRWFELSKLLNVLFLLNKRIIGFFHYSIIPLLHHSSTPKNFIKPPSRGQRQVLWAWILYYG